MADENTDPIVIPAPEANDDPIVQQQPAEPAPRFEGRFGDLPDISLWNVAPAFGRGFIEGFGPDRLGISKENVKLLTEKVGPEWEKPFETIQKVLAGSVFSSAEPFWRGLQGAFRGAQAAGLAAGLPRDIVSIATGEPFFGSPHPMGVPKVAPKPFVKPTPIRPIEGSPTPDIPRSQAAQTGIPQVDGILNSPTTRQVVDNPVVDRSHDVPYMAGGSVPLEDPTIYIDRHVPKEQTVNAPGEIYVVTDPLGATTEGETLEVEVLRDKDGQIEGFMTGRGVSKVAPAYRDLSPEAQIAHAFGDHPMGAEPDLSKVKRKSVTFDPADPWVVHENVEQHVMDQLIKGGMGREEAYRVAHFQYAEPAEQAWYRAHGIDQEAAEAEQQKWLPRIQHENIENPPPNLYEKPYPHANVRGAKGESVEEAKPTSDEIARAQEIIGKHLDEQQATAPPNPIEQARDLGVIGPERPRITDGTPEEAVNAAVPPTEPPQPPGGGGGAPGGPPEQPLNPWQQRFEHFVSKLDRPEDVKQLIRDAAKENEDFPAARQGDISLQHVEDIAQAAGVYPSEVDARGLGRELKNDAEVRLAMRTMLVATETVKDAAREVRADGSPENLIKFQEALLRRDLAVEQIVGLRAEWGRTGNVFQEFLRDVKDQEGLSKFLEERGRSPKDLLNLADAVETLDRGQAAQLMNDLRRPGAWDKFMYYWVNALISGPVTHTKYVIANAAFAGYESAVVAPIAGAVGTVRRAITGAREGVFIGEAAARIWGIVAGTPDALVGAAKAARTGLQTPLPAEIAQNIVPKRNKNLPFGGQQAIGGPVGTAIGIPMRGAAAIHSFFNFLGYRASMEAQAYRLAAKEGLRPNEQAFWERRGNLAESPTTEMMDEAIDEGYRLTYINELGPVAKKVTAGLRASKIGQLVLPFTHIPLNIVSRAVEGTPLAFFSKEARGDLSGANGAVKQDMAIARLVAGSAVGAWAVNLVANDMMTGYGPTDPKERAQWLATRHLPYSIRIGDEWISFQRFSSVGTMLGIHANLAEVIPHLDPDHPELTKALALTVKATGKLLMDEVGMQGLAGLIEAINEPERKGTRFISSFAGSLLPWSSFLRQTASAMDPEMREAKTVVDGLRYYIPGVRQGLLPKRNWLGEPIPNAGYGGDIPGLPGVSAILQHRNAIPDPLGAEMTELDLRPAAPRNTIRGVQLPPTLADRYQATAGAMTRQTLEALVAQPGWHSLPAYARQDVFKRAIQATRRAAGAQMQIDYPQIIQQGIDNRRNQIMGVKPTKLQEPSMGPRSLLEQFNPIGSAAAMEAPGEPGDPLGKRPKFEQGGISRGAAGGTLQDLRPAFDQVKAEQGGKISTIHIGDLIQRSNLPPSQVKDILREAAARGEVQLGFGNRARSALSPAQTKGIMRIGDEEFAVVTFK